MPQRWNADSDRTFFSARKSAISIVLIRTEKYKRSLRRGIMAHRLLGPALGLVGAGLLASHASPAQETPTAPETPIVANLSEDHLFDTEAFGPPLLFGAAVAIE